MVHTVEIEVAGRTLRLETGRVARQADGSIWASYGDTVVLATAVASQVPSQAPIFFLSRSIIRRNPSQRGRFPAGISNGKHAHLKKLC
jgi:Polyribonucleotide nucleotidyltransferase (polynucleotide phosphorylase)